LSVKQLLSETLSAEIYCYSLLDSYRLVLNAYNGSRTLVPLLSDATKISRIPSSTRHALLDAPTATIMRFNNNSISHHTSHTMGNGANSSSDNVHGDAAHPIGHHTSHTMENGASSGGGGSGGDEGAHEDGTISNDNGKRSLFCVNAWGAWEAYSYSCRTPCGTCLGSHPNDPYFGKLFRKQRHLRRVRRLYIIQQRGQLQHHRQHAARGRAVRYGVLQHGPEDQDRPSAG